MADPVTWFAIIGAVISAVSAVADYQSGDAQFGAQIDTEKYNRDLLRRQASNEALVASMNEDAQRREAAFAQSRTRAGLIEAGIGTAQGGSAVAVSGQAAKFAELDALNIRWEGTMQRQSLLSQADLTQYGIEGLRGQRAAAKFQATLTGIQGVVSSLAGGMGGAGGALTKTAGQQGTGVGKYASQYGNLPRTPNRSAGSRVVGQSVGTKSGYRPSLG